MIPKWVDWRIAILAAYAALTFIAMAEMGSPQAASWYALSVPFLVLAILPVALFCLGSSHVVPKGLGALVIALSGALIYLHTAWFAAPDAQAGLVFLLVPLLQFAAAVIWLGLVHVTGKLTNQDR
ncbi:hypothetical protein K3181_09030 [Qipengyuania sp. YG27]|uniref:Uncharacterized protein n=1 Tax=Qipengyuania mesophila TaxID=2867246 RepID=A0ABS7JVG1_9SPHN|nr:hypothetical protein [Qipengyuania mesophila]MBX7501584.1 hypothetical protein [Qipengyuania mesophila]